MHCFQTVLLLSPLQKRHLPPCLLALESCTGYMIKSLANMDIFLDKRWTLRSHQVTSETFGYSGFHFGFANENLESICTLFTTMYYFVLYEKKGEEYDYFCKENLQSHVKVFMTEGQETFKRIRNT